MKKTLRLSITLCCVTLVSALALSVTFHLAEPRIIYQKELERELALKQVLPEGGGYLIEYDEESEIWRVFASPEKKKLITVIYIARKWGYSSEIETMVGVRPDGTITGIKILSHNETPGLGARIVEKESSFAGNSANTLKLEDIDAVTGATVTSRTVVESIREAYEKCLR